MLLFNLGLFFYVSSRRAVTLPESHGKGVVRKSWERVSSQMNSSCSSCYVLVDWLFLSYSDASHAENVNNADTVCNFYWKLSGDLTKGSYSQRGKIVFIYLTIFLEKTAINYTVIKIVFLVYLMICFFWFDSKNRGGTDFSLMAY